MIDTRVPAAMFALLRTVFDERNALTDSEKEIIRANVGNIYGICERCDMAHLAGYALERAGLISPYDECFKNLQEQQFIAMIRCEGMEYELSRIRSVFERNGIKFIPLKGAIIRDLYPEGWMRTSSDIDVLVEKESLDKAQSCMVSELGYKTGKESRHDHSLHSPGGVHVELHFDLMDDGKASPLRDIMSQAWSLAAPVREGSFEYCLSDDMFYFYHVAHLAKHIKWAGSGMRPLLDMWLINNKGRKNKELYARELLKEASLDQFAELCEEISEHWFGEKTQISDTARKLENFILNCSTYGNMENRVIMVNDIYGGPKGYVLKRIFLPYNMLAMIYPIIKKHKWLTPFCEVARWFKLLSKGMIKKAIAEVKFSKSATKERISDMRDFITEIGL